MPSRMPRLQAQAACTNRRLRNKARPQAQAIGPAAGQNRRPSRKRAEDSALRQGAAYHAATSTSSNSSSALAPAPTPAFTPARAPARVFNPDKRREQTGQISTMHRRQAPSRQQPRRKLWWPVPVPMVPKHPLSTGQPLGWFRLLVVVLLLQLQLQFQPQPQLRLQLRLQLQLQFQAAPSAQLRSSRAQLFSLARA